MIAIGGNIKSGNTVINTWLSSDNNYALLEFRSAEEANNAFKLDGISLLGRVSKGEEKTNSYIYYIIAGN